MDRPSYLTEEEWARVGTQFGSEDFNRKPRPADAATVKLTSADSISPQPIEWMWPGWIARGRLHILAGQPGSGKTTLALAFAAIISERGLWPDGSCAQQGNVVIWSGEDDPADTLVPRLAAAGADRRCIHFVDSVRDDGASRAFDPATDMTVLSEAIERVGNVRLVIIDPLAMVATKDSHRNAETRRDLQPIAELCRRTGAAALGIHHLAKGTAGREPQERLIGSIAFAAVARVVMVAAKMPAQDTGRVERRALMRAKSNIGPDEGGFAYGLEQTELAERPGIFASRVTWREPIEGTAREVLAEAEGVEDEYSPRREAIEFLKSHLGDGPVPASEIYAASRREGISNATLRRMKAELGVRSTRTGFGKGSVSQWELPTYDESGPSYMPSRLHTCSPKTVSTYGGGEHLWKRTGQPDDREEVEF
jgi:putative DNA primase/helicase